MWNWLRGIFGRPAVPARYGISLRWGAGVEQRMIDLQERFGGVTRQEIIRTALIVFDHLLRHHDSGGQVILQKSGQSPEYMHMRAGARTVDPNFDVEEE